MGTAYKSPRTMRPGTSVYIATAAYDSVKAGYAKSLAETTAELTRIGIPFGFQLLYGNCHVDDGRNDLVQEFLTQTQYTDLLFIDSDLMWSPEAVLKIMKHEQEEIIAGVYPFKGGSGEYPFGRILGGVEAVEEKAGLLEVSYAPTGFMRIPRTVFEKMAPGDYRKGKLNPGSRFFQRRYTEHTYDGGDVTFCRRWIACGGKVLVDPTLTFGHIGEHYWNGRLLDYLARPENLAKHGEGSKDLMPEWKPEGDAPALHYAGSEQELDFIETAREFVALEEPTLDHFNTLAKAYGNEPWAATPEFLSVAWQMAKHLPEDATILECGSGLSTVVLAATGRKVVALEEHKEWAEKTEAILTACELEAEIQVAPMKGNWYDAQNLLKLNASMVVIDGPRRREGISRMWPVRVGRRLGMLKLDAAVIVDDVSEIDGANGTWEPCLAGAHPFVVGRLGNPLQG